ncbi:MAG: helix-turn-helix transcriptional regulator [Chloroflexota bacterium]
MTRAENKSERLLKMEALLLSHPEGLTQSDMARRLGVDRSVIHRNLYDFGRLYPVVVHDDGRISIDRSMYLLNVSFTLHEAMAVHLAARLLATRMDKHNPHAASALRKLGVALEKLAPRISGHVKQSADVMDEAGQRQDPHFLEVLEKLTLAWAEQRKAKVWHRKQPKEPVQEHVFQVYFIEPYAVGQSVHVIGFSETRNAERTLKVERIERVEVLKDPYVIPEGFDPKKFLADAWGIWYTDTEPIEVVLKFHPRVAYRVQESRWHRSEQPIEELDNGYVIWRAKIAEPKEMLNWIRGWGSDVEVLAPDNLRDTCKDEAQKLTAIYENRKGE